MEHIKSFKKFEAIGFKVSGDNRDEVAIGHSKRLGYKSYTDSYYFKNSDDFSESYRIVRREPDFIDASISDRVINIKKDSTLCDYFVGDYELVDE